MARILLTIGMLACGNTSSAHAADVSQNMVVSSTGQMRNDGKGPYSTGVDYVGIWLELSRWPRMSFDFYELAFQEAPAPTRTVEHHLTAPVPGGVGTSLGVFTSPMGNDLVISKPMTAIVNTFTDMTVGFSVSPDSAEVRFCNSVCSEYYSLIFGEPRAFGIPSSRSTVQEQLRRL